MKFSDIPMRFCVFCNIVPAKKKPDQPKLTGFEKRLLNQITMFANGSERSSSQIRVQVGIRKGLVKGSFRYVHLDRSFRMVV